jgi:uncharacterized protein (DUF58 family)
MIQRFLDPRILAGISNLELTAKTVVDGFISGLHRSPDYGFSQEFAEYRPYVPGDDLRYVDWNVYARADRLYLKRYRGETNTRLTLLLDRSASMGFEGKGIRKIDYARFLGASLAYLARQQRDATGLITFDDQIRDYVEPASRQGQWMKLLHAIDRSEPGNRTNFDLPLFHFLEHQHGRGIVAVLSDFYASPGRVVKVIEPLRYRGNDVVLFHILDPAELEPELGDSKILIDMETGDELEVSARYAQTRYRERLTAHLAELENAAAKAGLSYHRLTTDKPLDAALREYLALRQERF